MGFFLVWVLLTSAVSMFTRSAIGYFEHHIPKPELSGVLSLLLVLPFSALYSKWLLALAAHATLIRSPEALRASVWVGLVFEASQWVIFKIHRASGKPWDLVTCLLPEELEELKSQIALSGMSWWIKVRPGGTTGHHRPTLQGHETLV